MEPMPQTPTPRQTPGEALGIISLVDVAPPSSTPTNEMMPSASPINEIALAINQVVVPLTGFMNSHMAQAQEQSGALLKATLDTLKQVTTDCNAINARTLLSGEIRHERTVRTLEKVIKDAIETLAKVSTDSREMVGAAMETLERVQKRA